MKNRRLDPIEMALSRLSRLAPSTAAWLDWQRRGSLWRWGGPMNGQPVRQALVRRLVAATTPTAIIETGTYRGDTTLFLADIADCEIHSCEIDPRFHAFAQRRLGRRDDIHLALTASHHFLRTYADTQPTRDDVLFYLDAHWQGDIPLHDELEIISTRFTRSVVLIDDFRVPDDPGYRFEDRGPGRCLSESEVPVDLRDRWRWHYPSAPSDTEGGKRQGCALLLQHSDDGRTDWIGPTLASELARSWRTVDDRT
ncbi:MAG: hypothetical protein U5K29_02495 [Acidimicrobiales bacterium]|nr:hypothetical protein [Acidimicrobiales bacterium]